MPQVYKNYTRKSVDGLSVSFLLTWLAGDISNLIGSLFTNQLTTQKYTALFFVISDILLVLQYVYYKVWYFGTGTGVQFESLVEVCVGNDDKDENGSSVDSSATNVDDEVDYLTPSENSPLLSKSNGKPNSDSGTLLPNNQNSISSISSINKPDDLKSYSSLDNSSSSIEEVNLIRQYSRTSSNGGVFHRLERASEYIQSSSSSCTSGEIKINYEKPALDIIYEGTKKPMKTKHSNKLPSFFSKPAKSMILQTTIILQLISTVASSSDSDNPLCDDPLHQSSQWMLIMGSIMAWSSGLLYFFSRIPQILTNYKLKNVEGLSIFLFVITISANVS